MEVCQKITNDQLDRSYGNQLFALPNFCPTNIPSFVNYLTLHVNRTPVKQTIKLYIMSLIPSLVWMSIVIKKTQEN